MVYEPPRIAADEFEKAMDLYLRLIIFTGMPVSQVSSPELRTFFRLVDIFGLRYFRNIFFKLVEVAQERIASEIKDTKNSLMHDGWTRGNTHYVGTIAVCVENFSLSKMEKEQ